MAATISDIQNYRFTSDDHLFLDANIWIFIYGPVPNLDDRRIWIYSNALDRMKKYHSHLYTDPLVLSEFANRYARLMWDEIRPDIQDFKDFRNSEDFPTVARDIADSIRRILVDVEKIDCQFASLDHETLLETFEEGNHDFNDLIIYDICRSNNFAIVTHDSDCHLQNLRVLTYSKKLLTQTNR